MVCRQILQHEDGSLLVEGERLKQPELAATLRNIAEQGEQYFYNSTFTEEMVTELVSQHNSILTVEDFNSYEVKVREVLVSEYGGMEVHNAPPPAGGTILGLIMNIIDGKTRYTVLLLPPSLSLRLQHN